MMNRKKHQEDTFHLNRKKNTVRVELPKDAARCFECLSCPYRSWIATLWGLGGGVEGVGGARRVRVKLQMCG